MEDIIKSIGEAEERAIQIKNGAREKAAATILSAEERAEEISRLCDAECKAERERLLKEAEEKARADYDKEISARRAEAAQYSARRLEGCEGVVNAIVRRITRGSR